jgi:hypothetical protein
VGCASARAAVQYGNARFSHRAQQFGPNGSGLPPRHLGQCLGWDFNGPGVAEFYPEFKGWKPLSATRGNHYKRLIHNTIKHHQLSIL